MGTIDDSFPSAYNSNDGSEHEGAAQNFMILRREGSINQRRDASPTNKDNKSGLDEKREDRYGDNRADLPAYKEDNEYSYNRVRR